MAVQRRVNWVSQERVDLPFLRSIESAVSNDFDELIQTIYLGSGPGFIFNGFDISMTGLIGGAASGAQMNVANASIFHPKSKQSGTFMYIAAGTPPQILNSALNPNVQGAFVPDSLNYIGIEYIRFLDDTTDTQVYLWDPTTDDETTETIPAANVLQYNIIIATGTWAPNVLPVCTITTDAANNVLEIEDNRPLMLRLGTAGTTTPNPNYTYPWNAQPEGRLENPFISTDNSVNPFQGGDKMLTNEKDWKNAIMSAIKEIKGTVYWYSLGSSFITNVNLTDLFFDAAGSVLTMRGKFIHSQSTPGMLTWTGTLFIDGIIGPRRYSILPGNVTLQDTQVAYVSLVRESEFQPANTFTFTNGSTTVTGLTAITGIFPGDWIIYFADNDDDWAQVASVSGSTIILTNPYNGSSATGIAFSSTGTYTMQVAYPDAVPPSGNTFWIAKREDNGTITATIAAAPTGAVRNSGITTFTTTAAHGINAGQGVEVSGVAESSGASDASYTGTIAGTATAVTLTATTAGSAGNSIILTFTGSNSINAAITTWNTAHPSNTVALTNGDGTQVPNAGTVQLSNGNDDSFNGFFEVLTVPTPTTFTVQNTGVNGATSGGGTVNGTATIYLRGIGEVSQGETSSDDSSALEALLQYVGAASAGDTQPQYSSTNFVTQGIDLTSAIGELDARSGTSTLISSQDRNLKMILGGDWSFTPGSPSYTLVAQQATTTSNITSAASNQWIAQPFTPSAAGNLGQVTVYPYKTGTPTGTFAVEIWSDIAGQPGTQLATSAPINASSLGGSYPGAALNVTIISPPAVLTSTQYWIVFDTTNVVFSGGSINLNSATATPAAWFTGNSGGSWTSLVNFAIEYQAYTVVAIAGATLAWSAAAYIQTPSLADAVNTIPAGSIAFSGPDQVAYVEMNRTSPGGNLTVKTAPITSTVFDDNTVIIARYCSDGSIIVGTHSFRLVANESKALDAGSSDQTLIFIGSTGEADSQPQYTSHTVVANNDPLTTAISKIDNILSNLAPDSLLIGGGQNSPIIPLAGGTTGNVATFNGTTWVSAPAATAIPASYDLLNLGLAATNDVDNDLIVALKQFDGATDPAAAPNNVKIAFRSPTITSGGFEELFVTAPLSIEAPSAASFGLALGVAQNIYVYAINNAGTVQLGLCGDASLDEGDLQDTELLSAGTSDVLQEYTSVIAPVQLSANTEFVGQFFQPTSSGPITSAVYQLAYSNSALSGNMVMEIHADNAGVPGTLLESSSPVDASTLTTTPTDTSFSFGGATNLTSGTKYHLVLNISGVTFAGNLLDISQGTAGTPIAESLTSTSTANSIIANDWWAQSFTTGATGSPTVNDVILYLSQVGGTGATGNMFIGIYSDNAGQPGTLLGTSVGVDASTLTSTPTATPFGFSSGPVLSPSTLYWLVFQPTSVTFNSSTLQVNFDNTNPYAGGNSSGSVDGGATWTAAPSDDLEFEVDAVAVGYEFSSNSGSTWSSGGNVSNYFIVNSDVPGSNSNTILYTTAVLTNVPVRLIGRVTVTPGAYASADDTMDTPNIEFTANFPGTAGNSISLVFDGVYATIIDTADTPNITFTAKAAGAAGNSISLVFNGVYATITDTADTPNITFTANNAGAVGNAISLVFNGVYAAVTDTVETPNITFTADNAGTIGNSISLVFDGVYATVIDTAETPNITFTADNAGAIGNSISLVFDGVQASVTDTIDTPNITFTADNAGTIGNSISLSFDGVSTVATVVGNWNATNPANTVSYTGSGSVIPAANTWALSGGSGTDVSTVVGAWNTSNPTNTVSFTGSGTVVPLANTWNLAGGSGDDVSTITGNWNTANPTNTVSFTGSGTVVPVANTWNLSGGSGTDVGTVVGNWNTANPGNTVAFTGSSSVVPVANTWTLTGGSGDNVSTVVGAWNSANTSNQVSFTGSGTVVPVANTWTLAGGSGTSIATVVSAWNTSNPSNTVSYTGMSTVVPVAQTVNLSGGEDSGFSSPPSGVAVTPFKVDYSFSIGDVKTSLLTEAQYQAINGVGWVLADGRSAANTAYADLTGNSNIPDMRATVPRMKDNGAGLDSFGDLPLGTYEHDQFQDHAHYILQWTRSGQFDGGGPAIGSGQSVEYTSGAVNGNPGAETNAKGTVVNFFIRVNY